MNNFGLIFSHYFKRQLKSIETLGGLILAPMGVIALFILINNSDTNRIFYGYNMLHTGLVVSNMLFFALFGVIFSMENLHELIKSDAKNRLFVAPVKKVTFIGASLLASWSVALLASCIIIAVLSIFLNVYWGNVLISISVLIGFTLLCQVIGLLIFLFTKSESQGNAVAYPFVFLVGGISGMPFPITAFFNNRFVDFIEYWSPLNLAYQAFIHGGRFGRISFQYQTYAGGDMGLAVRNTLVIFLIAIVLGFLSFIIGRQRRIW